MSQTTKEVPLRLVNEADHRYRLASTLNRAIGGKTNNFGSVTLTASSATTTLTDIRIGINTVILLQPTTANAAAALTGVYFGTPGDGTITINHANNAQTDRTFNYILVG